MSDPVLIATGSYSRSGRGRGTGIRLLRLRPGAEGLEVQEGASVELEDPSFVLWNPEGTLLYAVLETSPTRVVALSVDASGDRAEILADLELEGSGGCHLAHGREPGTLLVADYGSGAVETVRLDESGLPTAQIDLDDHQDRAENGEAPHPHQVVALPGTELLAVPDLGLDRVFLYRQDVTGQIGLAGEITLGRGSGPRHLVADHESDQVHVSCERSGMIATASRRGTETDPSAPVALRGAGYRWGVTSMIPASRRDVPNALSHLELTADESALLVANRGPDTISLLSLAAMRPQILAETPVGEHPRHFTQLGDLVLVAAQEADRIDVLRRGEGSLEVAGEPIPAPSVACLAVRP